MQTQFLATISIHAALKYHIPKYHKFTRLYSTTPEIYLYSGRKDPPFYSNCQLHRMTFYDKTHKNWRVLNSNSRGALIWI